MTGFTHEMSELEKDQAQLRAKQASELAGSVAKNKGLPDTLIQAAEAQAIAVTVALFARD